MIARATITSSGGPRSGRRAQPPTGGHVAVGWCATLTTTFRSRVPRICVDEVPAPRFPRPTTVRQGRTGGYNVVKSTSDAHICDMELETRSVPSRQLRTGQHSIQPSMSQPKYAATNQTKFPTSFSEYSAPLPVPIQVSSRGGARGCLWCVWGDCRFEPHNPAFVLILAALAPPSADPHTAPWPILPPRETDSPPQRACP